MSMELYTDKDWTEKYGVESAWEVTYSDGLATISYWVDAQTGAIVGREP